MIEKKYKAYPEELPKATWSPLFVAIGIALIFWGIVSNYAISLIGLAQFTYGIKKWINDLKLENEETEKKQKL